MYICIACENIICTLSGNCIPLLSSNKLKIDGNFYFTQLKCPLQKYIKYDIIQLTKKVVVEIKNNSYIPVKFFYNLKINLGDDKNDNILTYIISFDININK